MNGQQITNSSSSANGTPSSSYPGELFFNRLVFTWFEHRLRTCDVLSAKHISLPNKPTISLLPYSVYYHLALGPWRLVAKSSKTRLVTLNNVGSYSLDYPL